MKIAIHANQYITSANDVRMIECAAEKSLRCTSEEIAYTDQGHAAIGVKCT
jgi:hypothetical protein